LQSCTKNPARAVRYRQLALAEPDRSKADLLLKLADEADRDVLCTADWLCSERRRRRRVKVLKALNVVIEELELDNALMIQEGHY
jgi:hypothetical protein